MEEVDNGELLLVLREAEALEERVVDVDLGSVGLVTTPWVDELDFDDDDDG